MSTYLFTSESVTEGHPDKVCDAISDAILDTLLEQDPSSRVACETLVSKGLVVVTGEITTDGYAEVEHIVKDTLKEIGYTSEESGMHNQEAKILTFIHPQSQEISQGVDDYEGHEQGAGDQGLMFGFACTETKELMPMPIQVAHRLTEKLAEVRKNGTLSWLKPDGKSQVSVRYEDGKPVSIEKVVVAAQHEDMLKDHKDEKSEWTFVNSEIIKHVIEPVLDGFDLPYQISHIVNGTGRFVDGGPAADAGLTGRKIIVDTYGGYAPHGGGAFSGKDPSKVDRSGAYMARYIAKNVVAAGLAEKCEVQFSYGIGVADPTSFYVRTFGTGKIDDAVLTEICAEVFPLKPGEIISHLKLKAPRYRKTAAYGHFGRSGENFTWENTDMVDALKSAVDQRS